MMLTVCRRFLATVFVILTGCNSQPVGPMVFHVVDCHFVDRETFAADLRDQDSNLTDAKIHDQFVGFTNTVETIQNEQMQILCGLTSDYTTC